jgi:hypothetical protein
LFDHLTAIRTTKDPGYYESLSETEKKSFNHWMILAWLSMDNYLIELTAFLWRDGYYDQIPSAQFYKLLLDFVPQTEQRLFWQKSSKKANSKLIEYVSNWYSVSKREAVDYLEVLLSSDNGITEIGNILEGFGLTDKEAEKIFSGEEKL